MRTALVAVSLVVSLAVAAAPTVAAAPLEVLDPGGPGDVAPDRDWDVVHLHVDLALQPNGGRVEGFVELTVTSLTPGSDVLTLHQRALDVTRVEVGGGEVPFTLDDDHLRVTVGRSKGPVAVRVHYSATPRLGLHFRQPGRDSPDTMPEVWSQGEGEDNRYWMPLWDFPNDRHTLSTRFTAPEGWRVISNGEGGWDGQAWAYRMERQVVGYLVMVAAGPYDVVELGASPVPVEAWVPRGTPPNELMNVSGELPAILDFLGRWTGLPYPYPRYTEVYVQRFLYGAMENTTAVVVEKGFLHPDHERDTSHRGELVSVHEAAHHWFGDLVTCRTWQELWLNEAFATLAEGLWTEHTEGPEALAVMIRDWHRHGAGAGPLGGRWWSDGPGTGRSVYARGPAVLRMLQVELGEEAFQAGVRHYLQRHQEGLADTEDLRRALDDVTGRHLQWFFDQWVQLVGAPKLSGTWRFSEGEAVVDLRQEVPEGRAPWRFVLEVEVGTDDGVVQRRVRVDDEVTRVVIPSAQEPAWVALDPRGGVLATWDVDQPQAAWRAQLERSPSPLARLRAMDALAEDPDPEGVAALTTVVGSSAHPAARAVAVEALAASAHPDALPTLLTSLADADGRLRRAAARGLAKWPSHPDVAPALAARLRVEADDGVEADLLRALRAHDRSAAEGVARRVLREAATYRGQRHSAAVEVLGRSEDPQALDTLLGWVVPSTPHRVQHAAAHAAVLVAGTAFEGQARVQARRRVALALEPSLESDFVDTRSLAIRLLAEVGDERSIAALQGFVAVEEVPSLQAAARDAITAIRQRKEGPAEDAEVSGRLEDLEERLKALEDEVEDLRQRR